MSTPKATGIETRHARSCDAPGSKCSCTPTYRAHAYDAKAGRLIRKTFSTVTEAKRWRTDAMAAVRSGDLTAERGARLRDAVEPWFAAMKAGQAPNRSGGRFKPSAIRGYEQSMRLRVLPALGDLRITDITTRDVQLFVDGMVTDGLAPATVDASLTALRAFYRRAATRGEVKVNPCLRIEKPGVRRKDLRVVLAATAAALLDGLDPADRALWSVAFYAGPRRGELTALRWTNVNLAEGFLRVEAGWDDMGGDDRAEEPPRPAHGADRRSPARPPRPAPPDHRQRRMAVHVGALGPELQRPRPQDVDGSRTPGPHAPRGAAHGRVADDRGQREPEGRLDLHGARQHRGHARPLRALLPGSETEAVALFDTYLAREVGGSTFPQALPHPVDLAV
ncbi:MAG: hypothetical protein QOH43_3751 [Solirubrobacteraceae bacterium]|nr:hypothetical protein [Solirubrobacteraceae bacterium]